MTKEKPDLRMTDIEIGDRIAQEHDEFYRLVASHPHRERITALWHARTAAIAEGAEVRLAAAVMDVLERGATTTVEDMSVVWVLDGMGEEAVAVLEHLLYLRKLDLLREADGDEAELSTIVERLRNSGVTDECPPTSDPSRHGPTPCSSPSRLAPGTIVP